MIKKKKNNLKIKQCRQQKSVMKNNYFNQINEIILKYKNTIPKFKLNKKYIYEKINTESCFEINKFITLKNKEPINNIEPLEPAIYRSEKVNMFISDIHKQIFNNWFSAITEMYNETLIYIRSNFPFTKNEIYKQIMEYNLMEEILNKKYKKFKDNTIINKRYIRQQMKDKKNKIQEKYKFNIDGKYTINNKSFICKIDIHILDKVIFQLIENIKSACTNMRNGNIKRFRLKFWKLTRPSQILDLEKRLCSNGIFYPSIFGKLKDEIKFIRDNEIYDLNKINCDFGINYNLIENKYYLIVPIKIENNNINENLNKLIALDPGLRTFMTGLSNNEVLKIAPNINKKIKLYLRRLEKIINNVNIPEYKKIKNRKLINRKISNLVDEVQWKTINYLTNNYKTILLGDMSAKSIVKKSNSILDGLAKKACLMTKYYQFQQRLKYKCSIKGNNYKLINEWYTSKTCSICGNYNKDLKGEKIYNCCKCGSILDRDVNGCRNIYMKQFIN